MSPSRAAAWWRDRHEAARALDPALTQPAAQQQASESTSSTSAVLAELAEHAECVECDECGGQGDGGVRVAGEPSQGSATLAWGADPVCGTCGVLVAGALTVLAADEGWCIGTLCGCLRPWYTRESGWYDTELAAWAALADGNYTAED